MEKSELGKLSNLQVPQKMAALSPRFAKAWEKFGVGLLEGMICTRICELVWTKTTSQMSRCDHVSLVFGPQAFR